MQPRAGLLRTGRRSRAPGRPTRSRSSPPSATTIAASDRSSPSTRIRNSSSAGTLRSSIPSMRAPFSSAECACSEPTATLRPVAWRAAIMAAIVEVEAASSMWPCQPSGSPSSCATQSHASASSSVEAGEVRHRNATGLSAAASISARIAGREALSREVGEEARVLPVGHARHQHLVEVAQDGGERLALLGRRGRQARADRRRARPGRAPAARRRGRGRRRPTRARRGRRRGSRSRRAPPRAPPAWPAPPPARPRTTRATRPAGRCRCAAAAIARSIIPARSEARTSSSRACARSTAACSALTRRARARLVLAAGAAAYGEDSHWRTRSTIASASPAANAWLRRFMNASAWRRVSSSGARSGCMRLAASRNSFLRSPVGSEAGRLGDRLHRRGGLARASARGAGRALVLRRARALGHERGDLRLELVQLGQHGDDLAHVVGLEGGELGLSVACSSSIAASRSRSRSASRVRGGGRGEQLLSGAPASSRRA